MKKNSWLSQWGILTIWGLPCLLQGGKTEGILAVILAAGLSLGVIVLVRKRKEGKLIRRIFSISGLMIAVLGMVRVAMWYSEAVTQPWILVVLTMAVLFIGRSRGEEGRGDMALVWGKFMVIVVVAVLIFQLPTMKNSVTIMNGSIKAGNVWYMGGEVFLLNLPFLYMGIPEKKKETIQEEVAFWDRENIRLFVRWATLWGGFIASVLCLFALWEMPILKKAPFPYLLLGQTGQTVSGASVRLEMLNFLLIIVSMYFSAGVCLDELHRVYHGNKERVAKRQVALLLLTGLLTGIICTGCGDKLGEKKFVLIGDEIQLAKKDSGLEFSCMKLLVVHGGALEELTDHLLQQPNISYETYVAYSNQRMDEDMEQLMEEMDSARLLEYIEELTKKGTEAGLLEYVTIRELLNAGARKEGILLPVLKWKAGKPAVTGRMEFKNP